MNRPRRIRKSKIAAATALFLVVSFNSPPSIPSIPEDQPPPPLPREVMVLEELADWVLGAGYADGFRAVTEADVAAAVQRRGQSFELFRTFNGTEARRALVRGMPFGDLILQTAHRHRIDGLLLAAVAEVESSFDPEAVSPDGALGLMQVLPSTASLFSVDDARQPAVNLEVGARYLGSLLDQFDGDLTLALAAYNAGPGNVLRYGGIPPFGETRVYVTRVLDRYVDHHRRLWETSGAGSWLF